MLVTGRNQFMHQIKTRESWLDMVQALLPLTAYSLRNRPANYAYFLADTSDPTA
jgi:hypothetical protein